ncbi:hypothetical protein SLA2020_515100 [Shorea laevis]
MEVFQAFHMRGGVGETSYAQNSFVQLNLIRMTKPIWVQAMTKLINYYSTFPTTLAMADLGCSSGPNTLYVVSELIKVVDKMRQELGCQSPEYQVLLSDLPGNDFNSVFRSLAGFQEKLKKELGSGSGPCFFSGVPGSFYHRLFTGKSLHFVHSSYSLHWLSQVPKGLETNKGSISVSSSSPPDVIKAYQEQFQHDFSMFLMSRSKELVAGGRMVLTFLGRSGDDPSTKECCYIWELLALALNDLVSKGLIEEEKMDSFNLPLYSPSPTEVKSEILKEGSFDIDALEVNKVILNGQPDPNELSLHNLLNDGGYTAAKCIRAVTEPWLAGHFGEAIIDQVFEHYREIVGDRMSKEQREIVNITLSLIKC